MDVTCISSQRLIQNRSLVFAIDQLKFILHIFFFFFSVFLQIRAKLKGKFTKDGYLEIPIIIASSDDQSVLQAQKNAHVQPTSHRPKRRKGTLFCVTGKNTFKENQVISNLDLCDEEVDSLMVSFTSSTGRTRADVFAENLASSSNKSNSNHVRTSRPVSTSSFVVNNGQFKQISMV